MKSVFFSAPLFFIIASLAHADCTYPKAPGSTPDGKTASKEQMLAAKKDYDQYNADMNKYLDCIKVEIDAMAPADASKMTSEQKKQNDDQQKVLVQKNNAAVEELQGRVTAFNEQLKAYKAAHQK